MNTQDHAERACVTRDNRNTTQNGVLRETPSRINVVPTGEESREEYHAGIASRAVTKTSIAMPAESRKKKKKRGVRELTQDPQMLVR